MNITTELQTSTDVLPSKNQALCEYCTLVRNSPNSPITRKTQLQFITGTFVIIN